MRIFEPLLFDVIRGAAARSAPAAGEHYRRATRPLTFSMSWSRCCRHITSEVAAMVIEPLVQCAAGMVMHPPGYLRGVRELTQAYDVLLIADEIAVGLGRTGTMFACEQEDVVPDFLCLGKGLTGGYLPMAATLTHDEIYRAFLGTYARRPHAVPRPHVQRQSARRRRRAGHARCVRRGANARQTAGENRATRRASVQAWPNIRTSPRRGSAD